MSALLAAPPDPTLLADDITVIQTLEREVNSEVIESRDLIHLLVLSVLAREHGYMAGEGGIGKSFAVRRVVKRLPGRIYTNQLGKDMTRDEFIGLPNPQAMMDGRWERDTTLMFPEARFALLDEFADASEMLARSFLTAMNERELTDGRRVLKLPLDALWGTANFWIDNPVLAAVFDRFAWRIVVQPVRSSQGFQAILKGGIARRANGGEPTGPVTKLDDDGLTRLQAAVANVDVGQAIVAAVDDLRQRAEAEGIHVNPRRYNQGVGLAAAQTVLRGGTDMTEEDLMVFKWVLPPSPEDFPKVAELCIGFASPVGQAVEGLRRAFEAEHVKVQGDLAPRIANTDVGDRDAMRGLMADLGEVNQPLRVVKQNVEAKIAEFRDSGRDVSELESLADEIDVDLRLIMRGLTGS